MEILVKEGIDRTWPRSRPERVESRMGRRKWKEKLTEAVVDVPKCSVYP